MNLKFADTPKGWYQERACGILASLSLAVDANERMKGRSGALRWLYQHEMEYHFKRAVFDTLRLLQMLTHDTDFANSGNLADICERGIRHLTISLTATWMGLTWRRNRTSGSGIKRSICGLSFPMQDCFDMVHNLFTNFY